MPDIRKVYAESGKIYFIRESGGTFYVSVPTWFPGEPFGSAESLEDALALIIADPDSGGSIDSIELNATQREGTMATVELKIDPANLLGKELTPLDTELASLVIDIFYLLCIQKEYGSAKNYVYEYSASITEINYNSPFSAITYFKNISMGTAKRLFEMITYYPQEREKRELANTEKKLDLLEKARVLRNRLIKDGISPDEATKQISNILSNQNATLLISGPSAPGKGG